ncbi:MAG: RnfABCDGE type electron transport complex subunit D [Bacilli bacterium]|nr:RnfABCDGE type electron transport complex subunit D [Bacilli bacterium]
MTTIINEKSPHLRRKDSLARMLADVLIALAPTLIFSLVVYQWDAARNIAVSWATMVICEIVYVLIVNRIKYDGTKHTLKEHLKAGFSKLTVNNILAPSVSAAIFALIMPARTDPYIMIYPALILGSMFGMIIGKLVFGGTGSNIFNPAAVGMVFAKICFGSKYVYYSRSFFVTTGGTPLTNSIAEVAGLNSLTGKWMGINDVPLSSLLFGQVGGTIGEAFKIAILVGMVYLLIRRAVDWRIIASYLVTFVAVMALAGAIICTRHDINFFRFIAFQLLSGGMLFGVTFMLTDPVTGPINSPSRTIFGAAAAAITCIIRLFGALPEGMVYSILICNMLAPALDYYKWSSPKWNKRYIIILSAVVGVTLLAVGLGLGFGGEVVSA